MKKNCLDTVEFLQNWKLKMGIKNEITLTPLIEIVSNLQHWSFPMTLAPEPSASDLRECVTFLESN